MADSPATPAFLSPEITRVTCNRKVIHMIGGAKLKRNGDFHMCCIGKGCEEFPCERVEGIANEQ